MKNTLPSSQKQYTTLESIEDMRKAASLLPRVNMLYTGIIPSACLSVYEYYIFLTFATLEELDRDILNWETENIICKMMGRDLTKWWECLEWND